MPPSGSSASADRTAVTLSFTEAQYTALAWEAARYQVTPAERLMALLQPLIHEAYQRYQDTLWQERRRILEGDSGLAAAVDAAGQH